MLPFVLALALSIGQAVERIADVRVQGNTLTPEADVVRMSGLTTGDAVTDALVADASARLRATGHFRHVEILKRYASIADASQILLIIIVDEGSVTVRPMRGGEPARAVRRRGPPLMFLPILGSEDGYGFTYGALVAIPNVAGPRTRLAIPATWGGERSLGLQYEKRLDRERLTRITLGGSLLRRANTALDAIDTRQRIWARGEREIVQALRLGVTGSVDHVSFLDEDNVVGRLGADVMFDTRVDPMLSRNAIYLRTSLDRYVVRNQASALRTLVDANGYIGGPGASTIVVRVYRDGVNEALPGYLKVLLGRESTLRGFPSASAAGDTTAAGTLEVRLPLTSPLSVGKVGVRGFVDAATVYDAGDRLSDQHFRRGVGAGLWFTATVIRIGLDVARGSEGTTRAHLVAGLLF